LLSIEEIRVFVSIRVFIVDLSIVFQDVNFFPNHSEADQSRSQKIPSSSFFAEIEEFRLVVSSVLLKLYLLLID
jgi:hypothetical protein